MDRLAGRVALITGASRGIGVTIARVLADKGMRLALAARSADALSDVQRELSRRGPAVVAIPTDITRRSALEALVEQTRERLGPIDVLVNNAGVEEHAFYEDQSPAFIERTLATNLTAPMVLTRLVLPEMLSRNTGQIVNVASLAGLGPAAFDEAYCASKHGLVGFTRSLRASLKTRRVGVSASVVCPGFVTDAGMFAENQRSFGIRPPASLGASTPEEVAKAVLHAIERDIPELIVNPKPLRPLLTLGAAFPRMLERLTQLLGANDIQYQIAKARAARAPR